MLIEFPKEQNAKDFFDLFTNAQENHLFYHLYRSLLYITSEKEKTSAEEVFTSNKYINADLVMNFYNFVENISPGIINDYLYKRKLHDLNPEDTANKNFLIKAVIKSINNYSLTEYLFKKFLFRNVGYFNVNSKSYYQKEFCRQIIKLPDVSVKDFYDGLKSVSHLHIIVDNKFIQVDQLDITKGEMSFLLNIEKEIYSIFLKNSLFVNNINALKAVFMSYEKNYNTFFYDLIRHHINIFPLHFFNNVHINEIIYSEEYYNLSSYLIYKLSVNNPNDVFLLITSENEKIKQEYLLHHNKNLIFCSDYQFLSKSYKSQFVDFNTEDVQKVDDFIANNPENTIKKAFNKLFDVNDFLFHSVYHPDNYIPNDIGEINYEINYDE